MFSKGHDTPLGHGQPMCEILVRSNKAGRSYGPELGFNNTCIVTLALEVRHWVKVMTHPWPINKNCMKYCQDPTRG